MNNNERSTRGFPAKKDEQRYYGRRMCRTLWKVRPDDVIAVSLDKSLVKEFGELLKWCAEHRKAYKLVDTGQLDKLTKSDHHEGICVIAKRRRPLSEDEFLGRLQRHEVAGTIVAMDGVSNPHNFGALMRVTSFFGCNYIIVPEQSSGALSSAAARISEGGSEFIEVVLTEDLAELLKTLRNAGFLVVSSSSHAKANVYMHKFAQDCVLVLGSENKGVSPSIAKLADVTVRIPGSEGVDSLNVATACAVMLSEAQRQRISARSAT